MLSWTPVHILNFNARDVYIWYIHTDTEGAWWRGDSCNFNFGLPYFLGDEVPPMVTEVRWVDSLPPGVFSDGCNTTPQAFAVVMT